jgi:disulfide bond formation protein DsbB
MKESRREETRRSYTRKMMMVMMMMMTIVSVEQRPGWGEHVQTSFFPYHTCMICCDFRQIQISGRWAADWVFAPLQLCRTDYP